jgi:hypothetical protein
MAAPHGFDAVSHERHHGWRSLLFKLAVCSALTALGWWGSQWVGLLISVMAWAHVFAEDVLALIGWVFGLLRWRAHAAVEGRFYQFKGHRIRVLEDSIQPQRWVAVDDLCRALGAPLPAQALGRQHADALWTARDGLYLLDDVALVWLRGQRSERAGRLAHWLEREVWFPARGRKASRLKKKGAPDGAPEL